jgi:DnaJ-class molecular chaperone
MIKRCPLCHGKGKQTLIKKMTFGRSIGDGEIETREKVCRECEGEGKIYVCPASRAPYMPTVSVR